MFDIGNADQLARSILREHGPGATAFAHARSAECLFYQDQRGQMHWIEIETKIRAMRVAE